MAEYIERETAIKELVYYQAAQEYIMGIPAADVATVRHGRWEKYFDGAYIMCSCCKASFWCEDNSEPKGDKVTQLVVLPCVVEDIELVSSLEETDRGESGFGSSGR